MPACRRSIERRRWQTERDLAGFFHQISSLANLVDYQDKAVVSRTIIDKKAGTLTLLSFDAGQELCERTAPFDAMCYIVDGEADVSFAGDNFHMKKGEMLILPEDHPHSLKAPKRFKMLLTKIATG